MAWLLYNSFYYFFYLFSMDLNNFHFEVDIADNFNATFSGISWINVH